MSKQYTIKLTIPEINHILNHLASNEIEDGGLEGWYFGNKEQFIKRHKIIKAKLDEDLR